MKNIFILLFLITAFQAVGETSKVPSISAQIRNVDFYVSGENIIITYDFVGTKSSQRYDINAYVSISNNSWRRLSSTYVNGDVGSYQSGGYSKRITWKALQQYNAIEGNLKFKITAKCTSGCEEFIEMVYVQGGTFQMGSNNGSSDEKPVHSVTVSSFYMSKYEVTQKQWREIMGTNPSYFKNCDNCPVESVSWNDVQKFIRKLNAKTGKNYRLPTEAEWEYAARGGNKSRGYTYAGSNTISNVAWYYDNSYKLGKEHKNYGTNPVGQKQSNELGIYDMTGNVWEWCSDWYDSDYYKNSPSSNPKGPNSGTNRVLRGGSWGCNSGYCRLARRNGFSPTISSSSDGFRLVVP